MSNIEQKRKDIMILRHLPVMLTVFWVVYIGICLLMDYVLPIEMPLVTAGWYVIYRFSKRIFCMLHRMMLFYSYGCMTALWYNRYHGFGHWLKLSWIIAIIIGVVLIMICIIRNCGCHDRGTGKHNEGI